MLRVFFLEIDRSLNRLFHSFLSPASSKFNDIVHGICNRRVRLASSDLIPREYVIDLQSKCYFAYFIFKFDAFRAGNYEFAQMLRRSAHGLYIILEMRKVLCMERKRTELRCKMFIDIDKVKICKSSTDTSIGNHVCVIKSFLKVQKVLHIEYKVK